MLLEDRLHVAAAREDSHGPEDAASWCETAAHEEGVVRAHHVSTFFWHKRWALVTWAVGAVIAASALFIGVRLIDRMEGVPAPEAGAP